MGNASASSELRPLPVEPGGHLPPRTLWLRYRPAMVVMSEDFSRRWEAELVLREETELIAFARLLVDDRTDGIGAEQGQLRIRPCLRQHPLNYILDPLRSKLPGMNTAGTAHEPLNVP